MISYRKNQLHLTELFIQKLNNFFLGEDLTKCKFIPILSEPAIYFQKVNDEKDLASLNINPKGKIETTIDFVQLYDDTRLAVYPSGKSNYLQAIDSLARINNRRFFKIPSVKSAEISLASYIARKKKFADKETYFNPIFRQRIFEINIFQGDKFLQIGSTLSVGKNSFNAHNVIVTKILLEMEHGVLKIWIILLFAVRMKQRIYFNYVRSLSPGKSDFKN